LEVKKNFERDPVVGAYSSDMFRRRSIRDPKTNIHRKTKLVFYESYSAKFVFKNKLVIGRIWSVARD
jgi:hypothetical protein